MLVLTDVLLDDGLVEARAPCHGARRSLLGKKKKLVELGRRRLAQLHVVTHVHHRRRPGPLVRRHERAAQQRRRGAGQAADDDVLRRRTLQVQRVDAGIADQGQLGQPVGRAALLVGDPGFASVVEPRRLTIELGGSVPGTDFDVLKVSGSATLDGTLVVIDCGRTPYWADASPVQKRGMSPTATASALRAVFLIALNQTLFRLVLVARSSPARIRRSRSRARSTSPRATASSRPLTRRRPPGRSRRCRPASCTATR